MKRQILIFSLALMALTASAQHDEQVTVEGKYRPKVNKVNKLRLQPETPQPTYEFPNSEVSPKEATHRFALDLEKISPTAFSSKDDKLVTPTQNFVMAGMGTRLSPIFLYKHNSMLTKTLGLGVGVRHNSSWLGIKDYAPSSYMNNAFDINLSTSAFDGLQLDAGIFYKNDMYHYYGVNLVETPLTDEQIGNYCGRFKDNTVGVHLGLASTSTRLGELSHAGSIDYQYLVGIEHFVDLSYGMGYTQNWWGDKNNPQKAGVNIGFQFDGYDRNKYNANQNRIFFKVNPFFEMNGEFYRLHLGARLDGATQIEDEDSFLAVRPDVSGSLFVLNKKLEFYAGLNGGRKLTRFGELVAENPFLPRDKMGRLLVQNVKLGFDGGVRTNVAEIVDLHLGVRYRQTDNDPLFVSNFLDTNPVLMGLDFEPIYNTFGLVYDETQLVSVLADMRVKLRNSLTADLGFAYNHYNLATYQYAWHRPTTEGKLKLTYDFNDELSFNTTFLYQSGRYNAFLQAFGEEGQVFGAEKLKDVFDLSLGADYKVNDQITAFALLDNVAHQKYQMYYNYPVTGIQFFAGVKLKF